MFHTLSKYFRVWLKFTSYSVASTFNKKFSLIFFLIAKTLRIIFFFLFLYFILNRTKTLAGYNSNQVLLFLLTYNFIDTLTQLLFREVYRFRYYIVSGSFDLILVKPMSPLFRALLGGADAIDFFILIPLFIALIYIFNVLHIYSFFSILFYILLCLNAFFIAASLHILVLCLGLLTTEVDNTVMLYRDLTRMATVPIDVYQGAFKFLLTYIIPVGIMMAFPAKSALGFLSWPLVLLSFAIGLIFAILSLRAWKYSLKNYSSASS